MNRKECLDAAAEAVLKNRQELYGPPEDGFAGIAAIWSVLLGRKVASYEVALCLAALKLVRATNSPAHVDNWADLAGYAACGAELATAPSPKVPTPLGLMPLSDIDPKDLAAYIEARKAGNNEAR